MKYNKWTVALAALGVVSLASAAKAEERATGSVKTALESTTISGYVDTSAQWNFGTGNNFLPPYRFNSASKADGFNLDVVQVRIDKPLDEAEWAAGYRVDLWAGPDANFLGTQSSLLNGTGPSDFAIRQAYVALRAPVLNGIDFKVGVFDSIIGYESVESPNNPNYTRSYGHTIEPQTHTGVLASYRFSDLISASVGVADTVGPIINERAQGPNATFGLVDANGNAVTPTSKAESYKTYMASVAITAPESLGFLAGSTLYGGIVNGFSSRPLLVDAAGNTTAGADQINYYAGATIATPVTGLRLGASFDYLDVYPLHGETYSIAGYGSFQATEKLSFHARAEYLKDSGKFFTTLPSENVLALTGTVQYDLWKNVISRLELRWDHSLNDSESFTGRSTDATPARDNAWMLAANIIYRF